MAPRAQHAPLLLQQPGGHGRLPAGRAETRRGHHSAGRSDSELRHLRLGRRRHDGRHALRRPRRHIVAAERLRDRLLHPQVANHQRPVGRWRVLLDVCFRGRGRHDRRVHARGWSRAGGPRPLRLRQRLPQPVGRQRLPRLWMVPDGWRLVGRALQRRHEPSAPLGVHQEHVWLATRHAIDGLQPWDDGPGDRFGDQQRGHFALQDRPHCERVLLAREPFPRSNRHPLRPTRAEPVHSADGQAGRHHHLPRRYARADGVRPIQQCMAKQQQLRRLGRGPGHDAPDGLGGHLHHRKRV